MGNGEQVVGARRGGEESGLERAREMKCRRRADEKGRSVGRRGVVVDQKMKKVQRKLELLHRGCSLPPHMCQVHCCFIWFTS